MDQHKAKAEELLRRTAADYVARESNGTSLITVTRADVSPNFSRGIVYFSCLPAERELEALHFLRRQRSDFREYLKTHAAFHRIPFIEFEIDKGEKNRQHLDGLARE